MKIIASNSKLQLLVDESATSIRYSIWEGHKLRMRHSICKYRPGWKRVWDETLPILLETLKEFEGGTGLQSRAFQQSHSSRELYTLSG